MMAKATAQSTAWEQVGARFVLLGTDVKRRLDDLGEEAAAERRYVERALQSLVNALEEGFDSAGSAVRDVKLRQDVSEIVASLRHAVASTFAGADDRPAALAPRPRHKPAPKAKPAPKSSGRPAKKATARPAKTGTARPAKTGTRSATIRKAVSRQH